MKFDFLEDYTRNNTYYVYILKRRACIHHYDGGQSSFGLCYVLWQESLKDTRRLVADIDYIALAFSPGVD